MTRLDFTKATRAQLMEIAYNDDGAQLSYKVAAGDELKRRARERHSTVQYKVKAVYPR